MRTIGIMVLGLVVIQSMAGATFVGDEVNAALTFDGSTTTVSDVEITESSYEFNLAASDGNTTHHFDVDLYTDSGEYRLSVDVWRSSGGVYNVPAASVVTISDLWLDSVGTPTGAIQGINFEHGQINLSDLASYSFTAHSITLDFGSVAINELYYIDLSIDVGPPGSSSTIPEPATLTLLGLGLGGMVLRKRWRKV